MTKPAFGDVRAPRQWNDTADKALVQDVALLKHEMDGQSYVVDGLFGIHVDDIMACGEGVYGPPKNHKVTDPAALLNVYTCCCTGSNLVPWSTTINRHSVEHTWNRA